MKSTWITFSNSIQSGSYAVKATLHIGRKGQTESIHTRPGKTINILTSEISELLSSGEDNAQRDRLAFYLAKFQY